MNWSATSTGYNPLTLLQQLNTNTEGVFAIGFLCAFWLILFIATSFYPRGKSILAASFITLSLSVLFLMANLIGWQVVGVFIVLFILTYILARD